MNKKRNIVILIICIIVIGFISFYRLNNKCIGVAKSNVHDEQTSAWHINI